MTLTRFFRPPSLRPVLCVALLCLGASAFAQVTPPPLPPGSAMVKIEGGMDASERSRQVRAHHHKLHHRKNYMLDDSLDAGNSGAGQQEPLAPAPTVAAAAPPALAIPQRAPATASRAPAPAPCPVNSSPGRIPTAGELAARQPRAGDMASAGAVTAPQAQAGCDMSPTASSSATQSSTQSAAPASAIRASKTSNRATQ